jgi:hypothetical protein
MNENINKNEESKMPEAIRECIAAEYQSIDVVIRHLQEENEYLEKLRLLPDDHPEKIKKKQEVHDRMVNIGIITADNELTDNYK